MLDIKLGHNVSCLHQELVHLLHPSHKKVDILKLCSSKIAWDNYALLNDFGILSSLWQVSNCVNISKNPNRPFYSCVLSCLAMNASEAGSDLALIQTSAFLM